MFLEVVKNHLRKTIRLEGFWRFLDEQELTQECILHAVKMRKVYDPEKTTQKLSSFVFRRIRLRISECLRGDAAGMTTVRTSRRYESASIVDIEPLECILAGEASTAEAIMQKHRLQRAIKERLTPKERQFLDWKVYGGFTLKEIGPMLEDIDHAVCESRACQIWLDIRAKLATNVGKQERNLNRILDDAFKGV